MTRKLTITYSNGAASITLFDGDVEEITWSDSSGGVKVEGRFKKSGGGNGAAGIIDMITKASKASTEKMVEEKRGAIGD